MSKITSCQNCCFAVYEGDTQTGCMHNVLENVDHVAAYNEGGNFEVIQGVCPLYRPDVMKDKYEGDHELAIRELDFTYHAYIDMDTFDEATVEALYNSTIQPDKIFMITKTWHDVEFLNQLFLEKFPGQHWQISHLLENLEFRHFSDILVRHNRAPWYLLVPNRTTIRPDLIESCKRDFYTSKNKTGVFAVEGVTLVNYDVHYLLVGNVGVDIEEKVLDPEGYMRYNAQS